MEKIKTDTKKAKLIAAKINKNPDGSSNIKEFTDQILQLTLDTDELKHSLTEEFKNECQKLKKECHRLRNVAKMYMFISEKLEPTATEMFMSFRNDFGSNTTKQDIDAVLEFTARHSEIEKNHVADIIAQIEMQEQSLAKADVSGGINPRKDGGGLWLAKRRGLHGPLAA